MPTSSVNRVLKVPSDETSDGETDLGDTTSRRASAVPWRARCVWSSGRVRRLAVREPEPGAQMPCGHVHPAGECLDVERLCVLAVDPVTNAAQQLEIAQSLLAGGPGHVRDRATSDCVHHATAAPWRSRLISADGILRVGLSRAARWSAPRHETVRDQCRRSEHGLAVGHLQRGNPRHRLDLAMPGALVPAQRFDRS